MTGQGINIFMGMFLIGICLQTLRGIDRRSKRMAAEYRESLATAAASEADRAELVHRVEFAMMKCQAIVNMYRELTMDTPKDQKQHRIVTEAADKAIANCREYLQDGTLGVVE